MYKILFSFLLVFIFGVSLFSQRGHDIKINIKSYENDTLIVGFFYGSSQRVLDTLINPKKNGKFEIKGDDTLNVGTYLVLMKPDNNYFQFMEDEDQHFKINTNVNSLEKIKVSGSKENSLFFDYLDFLQSQNEEVIRLREKYSKDSIKLDLAMEQVNLNVQKKQKEFVSGNPKSLTSLLIKTDFNIEVPKYVGTVKEKQFQRYHYVKDHYFEHIDLSDDRNINMPGFDAKITNYIKKWTPSHPDSIKKEIDFILFEMEKAEETYKYYLSSFLNEYGRSKIVGQDAIYVHLARNYYGKDKAPWADKKVINKILKEAKFMEPSLIGKIAPNVTLFKEDSTTIKIHDIEARFTVLFFWSPTCGHCKKSMPDVIKFQDDYAGKGVKVVAICTKHQKDYKSCWEGVKKEKMDIFLNLGDEMHRSRFKMKYNVRQTPKLFILDAKKEILIKDFPSDKLNVIIDNLIKEEEKEKNLLEEE